MNRRNIFGLSVIAALGLALLPGSALAQQKSLKEQLDRNLDDCLQRQRGAGWHEATALRS